MADYAGAEAAIRSRLEANWSTTKITYQNEDPGHPWPPKDGAGELQSWVHLEIAGTGSEIHGQGTIGNHLWEYTGEILVHVFVPVGVGSAVAKQYAVTIGEIFRAAKFYDDGSSYIRSMAPWVDGGGTSDDKGNWYRVTMTCPFTYWHRG